MAMKLISSNHVDKTLKCFQGVNNQRLFSGTNLLRKVILSTPPCASEPITEKGGDIGYSASSQGFSKINNGHIKIFNPLTSTLRRTIEQLTSTNQQLTTEGIFSNTSMQHSDVRRYLTTGVSVDKSNIHVVKRNLDAAPSNTQEEAPLLASRRVDPSTVKQVYYFDTLAFVKKLESKGFTREQAEGCAECLVEIINSTLDHQGKHMVTKPQQEIAVLQLMSEIVSVKKDMTLLQKSEFSSLKTETEKISIELSQIRGHMNDEIVKLKGQFSLDINLERGRAIEAHAENEKKLQQLHNKIETEIANLRTIYEVYRNDVFKYAGGTVIAVGGLMLGVIRLWH